MITHKDMPAFTLNGQGSMTNDITQKMLDEMVEKAIQDLKRELDKADHPIIKLTIISRHEGYGIALKDLGAYTLKLGLLVEQEAKKIEPLIRKLF